MNLGFSKAADNAVTSVTIGFALILTKKRISISSDAQRRFDLKSSEMFQSNLYFFIVTSFFSVKLRHKILVNFLHD